MHFESWVELFLLQGHLQEVLLQVQYIRVGVGLRVTAVALQGANYLSDALSSEIYSWYCLQQEALLVKVLHLNLSYPNVTLVSCKAQHGPIAGASHTC